MTNEAIEARKAYQKAYRERNRERINEYRRTWRASHKEQIKAANERYWQKKAASAAKGDAK